MLSLTLRVEKEREWSVVFGAPYTKAAGSSRAHRLSMKMKQGEKREGLLDLGGKDS